MTSRRRGQVIRLDQARARVVLQLLSSREERVVEDGSTGVVIQWQRASTPRRAPAEEGPEAPPG